MEPYIHEEGMGFLPFINKLSLACACHISRLSRFITEQDREYLCSHAVYIPELRSRWDTSNKHHLIVRSSILRITIRNEMEDHGDLFRFEGEGRLLLRKPGGGWHSFLLRKGIVYYINSKIFWMPCLGVQRLWSFLVDQKSFCFFPP